MTDRLLTATEAAEQLGVTPRWLLAEARARRVPHRRLGRQVRFASEDISSILAASYQPPTDRRVTHPEVRRDRPSYAASRGRAPDVPLPARLFPDGRRAETS